MNPVSSRAEAAHSGVILAAGRGSRLGNLTRDIPKCMVELGGRSLIDWQILAMTEAGIRNITVVTGYKQECLSGDFDKIENKQWSSSNMVRSLLAARQVLESAPAIVSYSDIVYHPDHLKKLVLLDGPAIAYDRKWLSLWRQRFEDPLTDAETLKLHNGGIASIGERAQNISEIEGQYMGLLKFCPRSWREVEDYLNGQPTDMIDRLDMTTLLQRLLAAGQKITAAPVDGKWCEVDSRKDLEIYERRIRESASGRFWEHDWRWEG